MVVKGPLASAAKRNQYMTERREGGREGGGREGGEDVPQGRAAGSGEGHDLVALVDEALLVQL